ncbi:MAG: gamma-glutamylcyclotransferase family protein, partial [Bryobacteraceae bacterium]
DMDLALFVYGSLMPGARNWKRYCEGHVAELHQARLRGRLYKLSDGYLAMTLDENGPWVRGWLLLLRCEATLHNIDRLEEFDPARPPENNVYLRVRANCFADDNSPQPAELGEAWTYIMSPAQLAREGAVEVSPKNE